MDILETFYGPNAGYVLDLYEHYKQDPASVDASTRAIFAAWSPDSQVSEPVSFEQTGSGPVAREVSSQNESASLEQDEQVQVAQVIAASALAHSIRERGHLGADLDPLGSEPPGDAALLPEAHGLTEADLMQLPPEVVGGHSAEGAKNALEAIDALRKMYSGTISYEFDQVKSADERQWLRDAVGLNSVSYCSDI